MHLCQTYYRNVKLFGRFGSRVLPLVTGRYGNGPDRWPLRPPDLAMS
jgi:hypothetical protein